MIIYVNGIGYTEENSVPKLLEERFGQKVIWFRNRSLLYDDVERFRNCISKKAVLLGLMGMLSGDVHQSTKLTIDLTVKKLYTMGKEYIKPLCDLIEEHRDEKITIIGHSQGGMIIEQALRSIKDRSDIETIILGCPIIVDIEKCVQYHNIYDRYSCIKKNGDNTLLEIDDKNHPHNAETYLKYI